MYDVVMMMMIILTIISVQCDHHRPVNPIELNSSSKERVTAACNIIAHAKHLIQDSAVLTIQLTRT